MKKVHYLPLALLLGVGVAFAAPRRVITGTVVSQKDGRPLELATARPVLRADTTKFLAGAVTDRLGRFRIVTDTTAALRLRVGFVSLRSTGRDVNFAAGGADSLDVGTPVPAGNDMALRAAVVSTAAARVEQQGDTTVFNAAAFRTALWRASPATSIAPHAIAPKQGYNFGDPLLQPRERLALFRASSSQWQFREARKCPLRSRNPRTNVCNSTKYKYFRSKFPRVFSAKAPTFCTSAPPFAE